MIGPLLCAFASLREPFFDRQGFRRKLSQRRKDAKGERVEALCGRASEKASTVDALSLRRGRWDRNTRSSAGRSELGRDSVIDSYFCVFASLREPFREACGVARGACGVTGIRTYRKGAFAGREKSRRGRSQRRKDAKEGGEAETSSEEAQFTERELFLRRHPAP
jgi:hypothetical protein